MSGLRTVPLSDIPRKPVVTVLVDTDEADRCVEIYGPPSHYTAQNPYWIPSSGLKDVRDLLEWVAHVGAKAWCCPRGLRRVCRVLLEEHLRENGRPC